MLETLTAFATTKVVAYTGMGIAGCVTAWALK